MCVKEVWVDRLVERVVLLWGRGQWGDQVNKKESEGKGRTSEREEVRGTARSSADLGRRHIFIVGEGSKHEDRGV